jgi:hypothetical protein
MMKLWRYNRTDKEYVLANEEIAKRFLESNFYKERYDKFRSTGMALVYFLISQEIDGGLSSTWEWDETKGSINGSADMTEILDQILPRLEKEVQQ